MREKLHNCLVETNVEDSNKYFNDLLTFLEENGSCAEFRTTFLRQYVHNREKWAYCFRRGLTTNNLIESFHRVFKQQYLKDKHVTRVDICLHAMNRYARDIIFLQARKQAKNVYTRMEIKHANGHEKAMEMIRNECALPSIISENAWIVQSQSGTETDYVITRKLDECNCRIQCRSCQICPHLFVCACVDNLLHANMCKHIHFLAMSLNLKAPTMTDSNEPLSVLENDLNVEVIERTTTSTEDFIRKTKNLLRLIDCHKVELNQELLDVASVAIDNLSTDCERNICRSQLRVPHNKRRERQRTFVSNKRRGRKKKN